MHLRPASDPALTAESDSVDVALRTHAQGGVRRLPGWILGARASS
jgi:hypothetical protein